MELKKITLTRSVNQILEQSFININIKFGFRATFTPKVMDKIWPLNISITININYWGNGDNYKIDEGAYHNQNWGEEYVIT
jgi:hypothetical protein